MRPERNEKLCICRANKIGDVLRLQQEVDGDSIALRFRAPQREMRFNQARQDVGNAGTCATKACKEFAARVIPSSICR